MFKNLVLFYIRGVHVKILRMSIKRKVDSKNPVDDG